MRILILVEEFSPRKGYLEYYLASELAKQGNSIQILFLKATGIPDDFVIAESYRVTQIPSMLNYHGYSLPTPLGVIQIYRIIKDFKPSLIICRPSFSPLSLLVLYHPATSKSVKIGSLVTGGNMITTAGFYSGDSISSLIRYSVAKFAIEKLAAKKLDSFTILAMQMRHFLTRYLNISKSDFLVLPLGADPNLFQYNPSARKRLRRSWDASDDDIIVTYTGQIIRVKDIPLLIEAFSHISPKNPKAKLVIVGDGDDTLIKELMNMCVKLEISDKVLVLPAVSRTELPGIFSASDIAVYPGGPSISIVEAASNGLPIIIRESPLSSYLVSEGNGFTIGRGNLIDLAEKLDLLIKDAVLRMKMGFNSRKLVVQRLNWCSITHQLLADVGRIQESKYRNS